MVTVMTSPLVTDSPAVEADLDVTFGLDEEAGGVQDGIIGKNQVGRAGVK